MANRGQGRSALGAEPTPFAVLRVAPGTDDDQPAVGFALDEVEGANQVPVGPPGGGLVPALNLWLRDRRLVAETLGAVEAGVFPPRFGWHCQDCPVRSRCWAWG